MPLCNNCPMSAILDANEVREGREMGLHEARKVLQQLARRSKRPAEKAGLAEAEAIIERAAEQAQLMAAAA